MNKSSSRTTDLNSSGNSWMKIQLAQARIRTQDKDTDDFLKPQTGGLTGITVYCKRFSKLQWDWQWRRYCPYLKTCDKTLLKFVPFLTSQTQSRAEASRLTVIKFLKQKPKIILKYLLNGRLRDIKTPFPNRSFEQTREVSTQKLQRSRDVKGFVLIRLE